MTIRGSRVDRRSLLKRGAVAGAAALAASSTIAEIVAARRAPAVVRHYRQSDQLSVVYMESGTYDAAARELSAEFQEKTGASVEVAAFPYLNLHDNAATDLVTETGAYDVIAVAYQWDGEFSPYLTPLDDFVARDGIKAEDFIPNIWTLSGLWDGKRNGIPNANDARGIIYRTDLYEAAGVEPPDSWDAYLANAEALTADGVFGASWTGLGEQLQGSFLSRYWAQGEPLCDESWRPVFQSNGMGVKSIEMLRAALPFTPPGMPGWDIPTQKNAVLNGELAQAEVWPSFIRADARDPAKSKIVDKWGLVPFPGPSELSIWNLAIPTISEKRDLAWEWIKMYTSAEKARHFADTYGIGSPQIATWSDPELVAKYPEYPQILAALQAGRPIWRIPQFPAAWDVLQKELEKTVYQDADPQATLDTIAAEWNKLLDSNPPTVAYTEG